MLSIFDFNGKESRKYISSVRQIIKINYRHYECIVSPINEKHHTLISDTQKRLDAFFKDRECACSRSIETRQDQVRYYIIKFGSITDAQMFEFALADMIDTKGYRFAGQTST
jgi:hypothetical protein